MSCSKWFIQKHHAHSMNLPWFFKNRKTILEDRTDMTAEYCCDVIKIAKGTQIIVYIIVNTFLVTCKRVLSLIFYNFLWAQSMKSNMFRWFLNLRPCCSFQQHAEMFRGFCDLINFSAISTSILLAVDNDFSEVFDCRLLEENKWKTFLSSTLFT